MNAELWQQVDHLFQGAVELEPARRAAFLDRACADNQLLRREVDSLLAADSREWYFIETPALESAVPFLVDDQPLLTPGQNVAHYEIVRLIGKGGMGEVYLARDRTLNRNVALKLLPLDYTRDRDRLRRFQREAQAASALNHPNILTIHQLGEVEGQLFIATEFIEGDTLRTHITRGSITLTDAVDVAIQTTSALAAAHKAGIVHRDIKPENIMLRPDGYVKVLDFGLAKLLEQHETPALSQSAEEMDTSSALMMGTLKYMSPEQARGQHVDPRSDIFSLGVVLYEMIAGRAPFENRGAGKLVESILKEQPPSLASYAHPLSDKLSKIVDKALSKERETRYKAEELLVDLKLLKEELDHEAKTSTTELKNSRAGKSFETEQSAPTRTLSSSFAISIFRRVSAVSRQKVTIAFLILSAVSLMGYLSYRSVRQPRGVLTSISPSVRKGTGTWTAKASISSARSNVQPVVLNGTLYLVGGWNVCTAFANLEAYDPISDRWTPRRPMTTARGYHGVGVLNGLLYVVGGVVDCGVDTASVEAYDPATDTWSLRAPLPTKRRAPAVAVANGKLYAIGGDSDGADTRLNTEYDPQTDRWIDRASMPTPRRDAAALEVNDIVYVIGGADQGPLATVEAYDPRTDSWTTKRPMLTPRLHFAATVLNGIIYAFGGAQHRLEVEAYDPATDTWTVVAQMPSRRSQFHAVAFDGGCYFAGGMDGTNYLSSVMAFTPDLIPQPSPAPCPSSHTTPKPPMPTPRISMAVGEINGVIYVVGGFDGNSTYLAVNEAYDPIADKWTVRAPMPTARILSMNNAVVDGRIYVIGGAARGKCTNLNEVYDPATDTWATRTAMPTARCHLAVVAVNGLIYALGGTNTNGSIKYATVEVYNPSTDTWTTAEPMSTGRQNFSAVSFNGILYAIGGWNLALTRSGDLNTVEAYDPISKSWTRKASLPAPRSNMGAGVINGSLVVLGGEGEEKAMTTIEAYDPSDDTWRTLGVMPVARTFVSAVSFSNTLYAFGGAFPGYAGALAINETYIVLPCSGGN